MNKSANISFVTLGCAKNEVDSKDMKDRLIKVGHTIEDDAASSDVIVVNTCSFIQNATEESIEAILDAIDANPRAKIIVSGCMPARYGDDLQSELPEVAAFIPCSKEEDIVEIIDAALATDMREDDAGVVEEAKDADSASYLDVDPVSDDQQYCYVKISDGCDRFCSFCTIPFIRGGYRSFPPEQIKRSVEEAVNAGKREIVLIAQDTGRYGEDLTPKMTLACLLDELSTAFPNALFRVLYTEPEGVTDDLLQVMAAHDNIANYLDIPLQHIDPEILIAMNRSRSMLDYKKMVEHIRSEVSGITLRTTFIAGFPGETEEQFDSLMDFVAEGLFDYVGVFPYSREEGTASAEFPGQLDEDEKLFRASKLRDLADAVSSSKLSEREGDEVKVLIEGIEEDGQAYGRCIFQAPEVDGVTYIDSGSVGDMVRSKIVDTLGYDIEVEALGE